jgi:beta-glucanase (GH16 family)
MTATLTFDDEFNSLSLWNGTSGTWSTTTAFVDPNGNGSSLPSNGEQEWYINANYAATASVRPWTVNNGVLTLTAQKVDPSIAQYLGYNQAGLPAMGSYQYTSGLIETNHSFTQTYGYFEMKAQLPQGDGLWPAFWLMRADGSWPPELDVMEALGKDTTTAYASVHTAQTGSHTSVGQAVNVGNFSSGYHTYAVDWEADTITFYYDNKQVMQVATPADMHSPMYMIANLAMGGGWAGSADASTPAVSQMNIDYIRAWDSNPYTNGGAIPSGTIPTDPQSMAIHDVLRVDPAQSDLTGLAGQVAAGSASFSDLVAQLTHEANATSSVATLNYEFFTGSAPTSAGMDFLVAPSGPNANNLNSAYYQAFNLENRYINFAVNLGKAGAGAAGFQATYGGLSLFDATKQAYATIFGGTPSDTKVHALLDPTLTVNGQTLTRADYLAVYGGDGANGLGTKAAMVGWLLAEAEKAHVGTYALSNDAFLTDVALHNAPFAVDIVGHYAQAGFAYQPG